MLMKIFTLFLVGAIALGATAAPTARFKHTTPRNDNRNAATETMRPARATAATDPIWVPRSQKFYLWQGSWVLQNTYSTTYTPTGKVAVEIVTAAEETGASRETNTYNDNDMLATRLIETSADGITFDNSEKTQRLYDSRLTDVIVENLQWLWTLQWEQIGNNYQRAITRDAAGNITNVEISSLYQGTFEATERLTVTYTDGKASKIVSERLDYNDDFELVWTVAATLTDIEWEQTDGQIYEIEGLMSGANKIKSCHLVDAMDDVMLSVIYTDHGYVATRTGLVQGMQATAVVEYEITDANGSERLTETFTMEEEGELYVESYTDIAEYDSYGYTTKQMSTSEFLGETTVEEMLTGVLTYDATYGYPLTYTTQLGEYDEELDELVMVNEMHVVMSDYVDATTLAGVENIAVEGNGIAEYYRLDGTRADAEILTPGIYVIRKDGKASKVIIR